MSGTSDYYSLFSDYLTNQKANSANTRESYLRDALYFLEYLSNAGIDPLEADEQVIQGYVEHLHDLKRSPTTISRNLASVRCFYKFLIFRGLMDSNPAKGIKLEKTVKKLPQVLSGEEIELLLAQPDIDGGLIGEFSYENFNAASASFEINGVNVHPGEAKDIMINAALVGCEIASLLPENETPAHTEGREGFYHLTDFSGDIAHAKVNYIVRDHDKATFEKRLDTLRGIEQKMNEKYHADTVKLNIQHSYSNMLEVIEKNEYVVAIAKKAIKNVGLEPVSRPVRGGTDGARLSFMGLPCPNLGTGGYGFHGPFEHISVEGMDTAVSVIKEIVKITAE